MKKTLSPEARRRRNELIIIGIISLLILIFTTVEMKFPQIEGKIPVANNIIIFSLININIILILLLIFLVIRNLVKLIFERKRKVLGARLRTKLVVAFVSLSLIPTILLFLVAVGFITNSVEHWFSTQVEQSLQGSLEVAQTYYRDFANDAVSAAQQVGKSLSEHGIHKGSREMGFLKEHLEAKRKEYYLSSLGIALKGEGKLIGAEDRTQGDLFPTSEGSARGGVFRKRSFQNPVCGGRRNDYRHRPYFQRFGGGHRGGGGNCRGIPFYCEESDCQDA